MSSKSTASRLGSFFGISNKHSTKRPASQKENLGGFRDAQQNTLPSAPRAQHDPSYLDIPRDASHRSLPAQNTRTQTESRQSNSHKMHYPQSLYTLPDVEPFSPTSPIALPTSPNARSSSDYSTLRPPSNTRPLLTQTSSDTTVPAPSPFGSPIDHGQNASGPASRLLPPHDPAFAQRPTSKYLLEDALERMARSSESDSLYSAQQPSGHDPLRPSRVRDRHQRSDGEPLPLDSGNTRLNSLGINTRAVPVSPSPDPSGSQPIRNRHQAQPLPLLDMSPTNEKSLAFAAAIAQANGLVLQPDPNRPSSSHRSPSPSPITPVIHYHISPAPEYPSPPPSIHSSSYRSGVSAAIQEALDSLHPPSASTQHLRIVAGTPFSIPASLPATPLLIASFPTTPFGASQPICPTGGDVFPSPVPVAAGQSPYLKGRLVAHPASNMDFYPQRSDSPSREFRDDEGFQMDLDEQATAPDYPEDDIVQIEPLEVYRPPPSTTPRSPPNIISPQAPTQPLATKSSKGHPIELDISGLARRLTSSTHKSSTKGLPPGIVPSFSADSPSTAPTTAVEPSPPINAVSSVMTPPRLLRKAQSQSRMRDTPASGASSLSSQSSLSWIGGSSAGSGGSSRLPGLPRRQKSFQSPTQLPVPVPTISSSFPGLRHAVSFNQFAASGSPPEDRGKGKEKEKERMEKEKATSPRKRFFNSSKYSSGKSLVLDMEYADLICKMHEAETSVALATQRYDPSLKVEISSPVNTHDPPLPRPQHSRPRSAPAQRVYSRSPSRSPLFVPLASTSPPNGQPDDEWASHFSSPLTVSRLIIHEVAASSTLRTGGVVLGTSPPLLRQIGDDNTSTSPRESPTTSIFGLRTEERREARQHIIPPSELLRLGEEAREHTSALHSPPSLSRGRSAGPNLEYPVMSGFAPNGTAVGFAALRARSTSTSRLPSDIVSLASPNLGANRTRAHRAGSAGTSISTLGRAFGTYASGSISNPAIDLRGAGPTRSLSVLSKASSLQSFPAARARRPSTAGSLQTSTSLNPLVGFISPNGGTQSLPPPPRPRLTSLRTAGMVHGPGHSPSARTSTSTDLVSPISTLTSAPTLSSVASWARTTSSPNISRPPSSASSSHPLPAHSGSAVAGGSQRQRSVPKKPSFLEIGDEDDDGRINGPEGELSVAGRSRMSRTSTNTASRTSSSQSISGSRSRAPSSASVGRSVHKVSSKASFQTHQQPVSVTQSESFLEFDMGSMGMGTIRQHPDELELGEDEHVLSYRY